jgi:hypothetical protein
MIAFLNLVDSLKMDNVNIDLAISVLKSRFSNEYSDVIVIPITESELICAIVLLRTRIQPDMMMFPIKFLDYMGNFLVNHLLIHLI